MAVSIACPVCRAENTVKPNCRRCKTDLSSLWGVESQRGEYLQFAWQALESRQFVKAHSFLQFASELRSGPDIDQYQAIVYLFENDFARAFKSYQEVELYYERDDTNR